MKNRILGSTRRLPGLVLLLAVLLLGTGVESVLAQAYVATTGINSVEVYDTDTNTLSATIPGTGARLLELSADGERLYSLDFDGVSVVDTATNTVIASIQTGFLTVGVAERPDGAFLYVANNASGNVSIIDASTYTVTSTLPIPPQSLALTPDGTSVWVVDVFGTIHTIDTATNTVTGTFSAGGAGAGLDFTPDGAFAYLTNFLTSVVEVVDTASQSVVATVPVGFRPIAVAVTPDGTAAYVGNLLGATVSVIDTATNTVVATVPVGAFPRGIAFTSDSTSAWVANTNSNTISVIDTATRTVTSTFPTSPGPWGIVIAQTADADGDGVDDGDDNCPDDANPEQEDNDGDGLGDVCDDDDDNDGVADPTDNCPLDANADQVDTDLDGQGDACDADDDGDGLGDSVDACPFTEPGAMVAADGCSIDQICPCDASWKNHGQYVSCVSKTSKDFERQGLITSQERGAIVSEAARSSCGK